MKRVALGLLLLLLGSAAAADVAVRRDGRVIRDEMQVTGGKLVWGAKRKREEPLRAYLLVEREDGTHIWSPSPRARIRGYLTLARKELRENLGLLAKEAVKARDPKLARRLYERAILLGLAGKTADYVRAKLEGLEAKPQKRRAKKAQAIVARLAQVDAIPGRMLARRAALAQDQTMSLRILREALRQDPTSATAQELLAAKAPKSFALGDARVWLDWTLEIGRHGFQLATGEELELKRARHHWRPDLYGVGSDEVFLVTALKDFERVGRCLAHGQLVCRALQTLFATDKPVRTKTGPLPLFLYMDRKAYQDHAGDYREIYDPAFLEWSTAHWSPQDDITRAFWPKDPDAERRFLSVFRQTIARHWMNSRNPNYSISQAARSRRTPGWWLARGFRGLIGQGRFDIETGQWDLFNSHGRFTDGLQALARDHPGRLHPWDQAFFMTGREAYRLPDKGTFGVHRRWSLHTWLYSPYRVYLDQAGAACRYLYCGDGGARRADLLKAIIAHYRGDAPKLNPKSAFGLSARELGKKTLEFAKKVAEGWRPRDKG